MNLLDRAFVTADLIFELFGPMEFREALVQCRVIRLVDSCRSLLFCCVVFDHFIGLSIVALSQDLGMPFNRYKALFDKVFLENWCVSWQNYATATFLGPVAERADVPRPIDSLEHEWRVNVLRLVVKDLTPVFALPPARIRSMESTRRLEEDLSSGPHFIVNAPARGHCRQA